MPGKILTQLSNNHFTPKLNKLEFLDTFRGLAAIYVLVSHTRMLLWEGRESLLSHPDKYSILEKVIANILNVFDYGYEAVLFFFVLSGFVIHLKYSIIYKEPNNQIKFDFVDFLFRRFKRIYPVLLFSLALTFILDTIGKNSDYLIYSNLTPYPIINNNITFDISFKTLLINLGLLGKFYGNLFGSNSPLWSLQYEWWFYMLYPVFSIINRRSIILSTMLVMALFIIAHSTSFIKIILFDNLFEYYICWWMGVCLADIYSGRFKISLYLISALGMVGLLCRIFSIGNFTNQWVSLAFMGLISLFLTFKNDSEIIKFISKFKFLGDFSYSLYITHFPILVFISGTLIAYNCGLLPKNQVFIFIGCVPCLIIALLCYFLIEKPSINFKLKKSIKNI